MNMKSNAPVADNLMAQNLLSDEAGIVLSVIIPCWNAGETLCEQLQALASQDWDERWEVVVVDDDSTDDTLEVARRFRESYDHFRILELEERRGAAGSRNAGAAVARGSYLAFCDADDVVGPSWVATIGETVKEQDFVAGPIDPRPINDPDVLRAHGPPQSALMSKYAFLPHAYGCNLAVRKDIHEEIGGFDESFPHGQDADYCWRVQLSGTPLREAPDAWVAYRLRSDWRGHFRQSFNWAVADVHLHRKYDRLGMSRLRIWSGIKSWVRLVLSTPLLFSRSGRLRFARLLGFRIGRLKGAWKHRYPAL